MSDHDAKAKHGHDEPEHGHDADRNQCDDAAPGHDLPEYRFTIEAGQVVGVQEVSDGHAHGLRLPDNASFSIGAQTITEVLTSKDSTTVIVYAQAAGSTTLYDKADISTTFNSPSTAHGGYAFTLDGAGAVSAVRHVEIDHGHPSIDAVRIPLGAVFTTSSGLVVEQHVKGAEIESIFFTQPSGSTLYAVEAIERTYIPAGTAATSLAVDPTDRMTFTFDASGAVAQARRLDPDGGSHKVSDHNVTFTRLGADNSYVEKVTSHGSETNYAVYFAGQSTNGVYTEVAHGVGSSVDLAGLQAQLNAAEQLLYGGAKSPDPMGWVI